MSNLKLKKIRRKYKKWIVYDSVTNYQRRFKTKIGAWLFLRCAIKKGY